jgi:hypothetical protein
MVEVMVSHFIPVSAGQCRLQGGDHQLEIGGHDRRGSAFSIRVEAMCREHSRHNLADVVDASGEAGERICFHPG